MVCDKEMPPMNRVCLCTLAALALALSVQGEGVRKVSMVVLLPAALCTFD